MKSGGIRRLGLKPCDRCSRGTWTDSNGINRRCSFCKGTGKVRETAPVESEDNAVTLDAIRDVVGPCREWLDADRGRCNAPAEYVLWGKLIDADGLGPRCWDHAVKHVGPQALGDRSWAIIDLGFLARRIDHVRPEAAYVDGSQDDLTRDLDVITDIAASSLDDPGDAAA